jgi:hypothetical protein
LNAFSPSVPFLPLPENLLSAGEAVGLLNIGTQRCPGAQERDPGDGSIPFTNGGALTDGRHGNGECNPEQGAQGP